MVRRVRSFPLVVVVSAGVVTAAAGCGSESGDPANEDGADAAASACRPTAELGHCVDSATGDACLDFEATTRQFVPLGAATVVEPITGPQGSDMFVLAVRGSGIDPGTTDQPSRVEVVVYAGPEERGRYTSFPTFVPDAADAEALVAPQLFTVVFDAASLEGQSLRATGSIREPDGDRHCGEAEFLCGALVEAN